MNNEYYNQNSYNQESYNAYDSVEASTRREGVVNAVVARSFAFMVIALMLTAVTASVVWKDKSLFLAIYTNREVLIGLIVAELAVVMLASYTLKKNLVVPSAILFILYSVINGATLSSIFFVYQLGSITDMFILATVVFAIMAVIGFTTKIDLSRIGVICMMGLISILVLSIANLLFLHSAGLDLAINAVGLIIFVALTAYDIQKIKALAMVNTNMGVTSLALFGALELYLDFINIFLKLLALFGDRR